MIKSYYYYACIDPFLGITVHCKGCKKLRQEGQIFLGSFYEYHQAAAAAKRRYSDISQCPDCLKGKHSIPGPVVMVEAVKPKARQEAITVKPRICAAPPLTVKPESEPVRMRQKPEARLSPVPVPELRAKSNVHRVPRKHSPGNY
ncbi:MULTISPECIES: hypothetical protein [Pantoea]|uniref:Uncharacterized protein n=1 Tax=Pantoea brenneri TaxID=472694 RepID=A0A653YRW0_9GAMM|nr:MULTISPECIES: hypothetical protein [Pantoea]MBZ6396901.1 hypothetical protein [Pantoea sp.]MBZ6440121.1 hypothetical protein [Pantoea sp.]MCQ5473264.1 hypothetical protein [Pantoea brenneri]MDH1089268.1 hypothetical protein [Pantoea brenneri]MDU4129928.1 hypothetical protein [Pantoea sp.]